MKNSWGQSIRHFNIESDSQEIDTSEFPSGIYFLINKNYVVKLVKL
jgi:hypothetical protein